MIIIYDWMLYASLALVCIIGVIIRTVHYRLVAHRLVMLVVIAKNICQVVAYGRITWLLYGSGNHVDKVVLLAWTMYLAFYIANIALNLLDVHTVWNTRRNDE